MDCNVKFTNPRNVKLIEVVDRSINRNLNKVENQEIPIVMAAILSIIHVDRITKSACFSLIFQSI